MAKTVYVLGAGFSRPAKLPLQADILGLIRDFNIMDIRDPTVASVWLDAHARVSDLLDRLPLSGTLPVLEDLFTVLDQSIGARDSFAGLGWVELVAARDALTRATLVVLHSACDAIPTETRAFYKGVAAELLAIRIMAGQAADPCTVISLNWDYIFEDSLYTCLRETALLRRADVDFCCYTTPLDDDAVHVPSVTQKARGLFNFKLLKLHGSANFLRCPGCNRLFTAMGSTANVWASYVLPRFCPHCPPLAGYRDKEEQPDPVPPLLEPLFITPTYLKVFDSAHIRMIWHNAHIDLSEADEVVFIGYSFPDADYHVRTLLRRSLRRGIKVRVVLSEADRTEPNADNRLVNALPPSRYVRFFGSEVEFDFGGIEAAFPNATSTEHISSLLESIKAKASNADASGGQANESS